MQMKRISIVSLWCLMIIACASRQVTDTTILTNTPFPLATRTPMLIMTANPLWTITPIVVGTPMLFNSPQQNIDAVISKFVSPCACRITTNVDLETYKDKAYLAFIDVTGQVDLKSMTIEEIAESINRKYRSYVVREYVFENCSTCYRGRIYIDDIENGKIFRIDWESEDIPLEADLIWVGEDNILVNRYAGQFGYEWTGIDVTKQEYIYYAQIECPC